MQLLSYQANKLNLQMDCGNSDVFLFNNQISVNKLILIIIPIKILPIIKQYIPINIIPKRANIFPAENKFCILATHLTLTQFKRVSITKILSYSLNVKIQMLFNE